MILRYHLSSWLLFLVCFLRVNASFSLTRHCRGYHCFDHSTKSRAVAGRFGGWATTSMRLSSDETIEEFVDISKMRMREIQSELKDRWNVSYEDCFDKESLVKRLDDARKGLVISNAETAKRNEADDRQSSGGTIEEGEDSKDAVGSGGPALSGNEFNREEVFNELSKLRVAELRQKLGERKIRWANMIEKRDLVDALVDSMEASAGFSVSGVIVPGEVADITAEELSLELSQKAGTPLLLDVYAVWCGPCQMMAPQLKIAAEELGGQCRVAKIDSDKYGEWSAKLKVGGLPTVVVFDSEGKEVNRQEGAVMSAGLVSLVQPHI